MSKNGKTIGQYWDSFSTTKRVVIILVTLGFIGSILGGGGKPNPCDCAEVMSRESYIGFYNMSDSNQILYNKCANSYWDRNAANRECMNKAVSEFYGN